MGVYSSSSSFIQLKVEGELPVSSRFEFLSKALTNRAFKAIDDSNEECSEGWVHTDATDKAVFDVPATFMRDHYLFFSYRRDQRKIPGSALRSHINKAEQEYLEKRPELKRVPKREREEIKDRVRLQLMAKTIPAQTTVDVAWDMNTDTAYVFSASAKEVDRVVELFNKSFENLRLVVVSPYQRLLQLVPHLEESLASQNKAYSDALLDLIESNTWIGRDFLSWLLYHGVNGGQFQIDVPGTSGKGNVFAAWIDNKIQLQGVGEAGVQKVTVSGSQDKYIEARSALAVGKSLTGATVFIESEENQWKFTLDAKMFSFKGFKCPPVTIDRDADAEMNERESAFYERMYLLEAGQQFFYSLLHRFASNRLGPEWQNTTDEIQSWLEGAGEGTYAS